jgi:hypothetical protein
VAFKGAVTTRSFKCWPSTDSSIALQFGAHVVDSLLSLSSLEPHTVELLTPERYIDPRDYIGAELGTGQIVRRTLAIRFRDSLRIIPQVPGIAAVLAVFCTVQLGTAAVAVLGPVVANQSLGGIGAWSAIVTAMAAAALIGSAIATKLHVRNIVRWTLVAFSAFTPIELLAIAVPFSVWVILGVVVCTTVVTEIAGVVFRTYVQRSVSEEYLARVGALESGLLGVMNPIGIALAFPMASLVGIRGFLIGAGAIVLLTALAAGGSMHAFGVQGTDLMSVHTTGESATKAETRDVTQT